MPGKLESLVEKAEKVLDLLERIKRENVSLKKENVALKAELTGISKEYRQLKLDHFDRSDEFKSRLLAVMSKLDELEELHR